MKIGKIIQALNHPIRRDIVERLKEAPMTAGELAELYKVSKPTMSTHFAALKDADLVAKERDKNSIIYHLNTTVAEEALIALTGLLENVKEVSPIKRVGMVDELEPKS
jgi:DNA-binding transcriptional ArsR family regulator